MSARDVQQETAKIIHLADKKRLIYRQSLAPKYAEALGLASEANGYRQTALSLEYAMPSGVPAIPRPPLRLLTRTEDAPDPAATGNHDDTFFDRQRTPDSQLPDPTRWTAQLTQAIVEVWHGRRPVHQLARWMNGDVYSAMVADSGLSEEAVVPRNAAHAFSSKADIGHLVRSVHIGRPSTSVVEASAVVTGANRSRAIALRLEGWDGRWLVTSLAVL